MQTEFAKMIDELEVESEWARTHGTNKAFQEGRLSGLATAKHIIEREARAYNKKATIFEDDGK